MASFNDFIDALRTDLIQFAEQSWKEHRTAAVSDGHDFVQKTKVDLERWTRQLEAGDLTKEDFEWLVKGKRDLAELTALKRQGLAKVALDKFTNGLVQTIASTAFRVFL
jgi:hypothetical protein